MSLEFHQVPNGPNEILEMDDFFISYNPGRERNPYDNILHAFGRISDENLGRSETALVLTDSSKMFGRRHLILYGDWRSAYRDLAAHGKDACVAFFEQNLEHITATSDTVERQTQ